MKATKTELHPTLSAILQDWELFLENVDGELFAKSHQLTIKMIHSAKRGDLIKAYFYGSDNAWFWSAKETQKVIDFITALA